MLPSFKEMFVIPPSGMTRRAFFHQLMTAGTLLLSYQWGSRVIWASATQCRPLEGQTIRWIVPHAVGGGYDTYSRLIAPFLAQALKAEMVIENIPGAGGIVGARAIMGATPDGLTIGILDGSGMLVASLAGESQAPEIANDFDIVGRIARSRQVWAVRSGARFQSISDVLRAAAQRPIVFGTLNVASLSFCNIVIASHLLGVDAEIVSGYRGSKAGVLAVQRGDVEIVCYSFESIRRHIESGAIKPILQISDEPISPHPLLQDVPILGGADGLAHLRSREMGRDPREAELDVNTLMGIIDVGRLIVAPKGLTPEKARCLAQALFETLATPNFRKAATKAKRSLEVGDAESVNASLQVVARRVDVFRQLIQGAIRKVLS
jgi:tripartite-type tricarboxylate transporter receptor subunit TctC